ncbi:trigger factor [Candidatus Leptofilum sp.]|uniref:trigger factor n=1 Tax=Candidatus Leptofilum sp. TaxID=3241576 RepID=UPI003B5C6299
MTLNIQTEQDEQRQLLMTIEVPEDRVEKQMRQTARKLAKEVNIPGFRRGKVPYQVLLKRLGREALRTEAVEDMLQSVFTEALDEVDPDIYAPANFDDMEMEPLVLKFTIPLTPEVTLGNYRELRKEIEPVEITEEAIDEALERIQAQHQELEDADRPVEPGDMVTLSGKGELLPNEDEEAAEADEETEADEAETAESEEASEHPEDNIIFNTESVDLVMDGKQIFWGGDFVNNIIGMAAGDEKTFNITFPEDFDEEELAGREATFNINVLNVQSRNLPPLDDELAKLEGTFETLDELRDSIRTELQNNAEGEAKNELIEGMIDDMLEDAELIYPPAAVETEIDGMVNNFKNQVTRAGWSWEDFLQLQNTQEDDLRENFREGAEEQLKRQLVLRQFIFDEKLRVNDDDIEAAIDERVSQFSDNEALLEGMKDYYKSGPGFDMLSSEVLMDKTYERIEAVLSGNAPDLAELEAEEAAEVEDEDESDEAEETAESEEVTTDAEEAAEENDAEETGAEVEEEVEELEEAEE